MTLHTFLSHPIVRGALSGALAAAGADFHAFKSWQSFHDAAVYSWATAAFRWFQGAVLGGVMAAGLGGF